MGGEAALTKVVPAVVLSSGHKMPLIGLGTAGSPLQPTEALADILMEAIEMGYRHFDTAAIHGTEAAIGQAVARALERHLIKSRGLVFIISKLRCTDADRDLILPARKETLGLFLALLLLLQSGEQTLAMEKLIDLSISSL
ncbi:methylecgonone reductase-like [Punica granatum]|uniref:Methylecgonone reductase-like n=2 Tax=Punica granatum TaxID=22663 RepID=A0A6P8BTC3_PUNGR|nr:methylecgonone reductase-like [Punica granatum]PKI66821.1 hypothetical protein CRG98_012827 [Punica granatum]